MFSSDLAVRIINELAKQPLCAMDIAKRLKENEQKIYYHLRKMKAAGVVKLNGTEQRYGMTAKIFQLVSPVVATKLYDKGYKVKSMPSVTDSKTDEFLRPFIKDGKLNCEIIAGDPFPHGKFNIAARDGIHIFDLAILLGKTMNNLEFLNYKFDTDVESNELKDNLILFGEPKANMIIDEINPKMPVYFDYQRGYEIVSRMTKEVYDAPRIGVVIKTVNPWNKNKKMLVISGIGSRGIKASVIAITQHIDSFVDSDGSKDIARIVEGLDKDGDGIIDSVRFLE